MPLRSITTIEFNNDRFYLIDGKLCVDHIVRDEHLAEDFEQIFIGRIQELLDKEPS